jgi:hypothetical protein
MCPQVLVSDAHSLQDPKNKKGLCKADILQRAANVMYFVNRRDEGVTHPRFFNPFPHQALAGILPVRLFFYLFLFSAHSFWTKNTIDEYPTGIRTDVPVEALKCAKYVCAGLVWFESAGQNITSSSRHVA